MILRSVGEKLARRSQEHSGAQQKILRDMALIMNAAARQVRWNVVGSRAKRHRS